VPNYAPPADAVPRSHGYLLAPRTRLWRLHNMKRSVGEFNRTPVPERLAGGRFDATPPDPYGYAYAAREESTAVVERMLRDARFDGPDGRLVPYRYVRDRRLTAVEVAYELRLTALVSAVNLAAVGQDDWLVQAEPAEFSDTRRWASWMREVDPVTQGLIWQSRRDRPHDVLVLFEDRCTQGPPLVPLDEPPLDLDTSVGMQILRRMLRPYHATVDPSCDDV
jgi:hypothetical protein